MESVSITGISHRLNNRDKNHLIYKKDGKTGDREAKRKEERKIKNMRSGPPIENGVGSARD